MAHAKEAQTTVQSTESMTRIDVTVVDDVEKGTENNEVAAAAPAATAGAATTAGAAAAAAAKNRKRGRIAKYDDTFWLREIASLFVAFACFAVVVIILAVYQGRALPDWPAMISINSLVAILLALLKPALAFPLVRCFDEVKWVLIGTKRTPEELRGFDAAIRGPWGAFVLLFGNFGKLASFGAVLMIVSIAVEPFMQQAILYKDCLVSLPDTAASIARTNLYSFGGNHTAGGYKLDDNLALALYVGMINPPVNATAAVNFNCPSGNCTFERAGDVSYSSIAMCSHVEDITANITATKVAVGSSNYTSMNYTLPDPHTQDVIAVYDQTGGLYMATAAEAMSMEDVPWAHAPFSFRALMLTFTCLPYGPDCMKPIAFDAYMWPCISAYTDVSINNFVLSEQMSQTTSMLYTVNDNPYVDNEPYWFLTGNYPAFPGIDCTPSTKNEDNKTEPAYAGPNGNYYYGPSAVTNNTQYYDPLCTWLLGERPTAELGQAAQTLFDSTIRGTDNNPFNSLSVMSYTDPQRVDGPIWLQRLYQEGHGDISNANTFMRGLADSVTAMMRQNLNDTHIGANVEALGTVLHSTTCVDVLWPWFALPASVMLMTILFLLCTMATLRGSGKSRAPRNTVSDAYWGKLSGSMYVQAASIGKKGSKTVVEEVQKLF